MKFLDGHIRFILAKNFIDESFELRNSYWEVRELYITKELFLRIAWVSWYLSRNFNHSELRYFRWKLSFFQVFENYLCFIWQKNFIDEATEYRRALLFFFFYWKLEQLFESHLCYLLETIWHVEEERTVVESHLFRRSLNWCQLTRLVFPVK